MGLRVGPPDGKLASGGGRVVTNVSGYDMMKLHYGALGARGVIVAASFKVFPKPLQDVTVTSEGGWDDATRALSMPVSPSALEVFSDGRVLARYTGSRDAVDRVVGELGWTVDEQSIWERHSSRAPVRWARIATPRSELRQRVEALPRGAGWRPAPGSAGPHRADS